MIATLPADTPVTTPVALTLAIDGEADDQMKVAPETMRPLRFTTLALSGVVKPATTVGVDGDTVTRVLESESAGAP